MLNKIRKILILVLINFYIMTNICHGQEFAIETGDALSPRVIIASDFFINSFPPQAVNGFVPKVLKEYDPDVFTLDNGDLSIAGRVFVELRIIMHELDSYLTPVFAMPVTQRDLESANKSDLNMIQEISDDLKQIHRALNKGFEGSRAPSVEDISDIIMQVNGIRSKYAGLIALKNKGGLSVNLSFILNSEIFCIEFLVEHTDAVLQGTKEEEFDIRTLFKKEKQRNILNVQGLKDPNVFGYRSGLSFVIKNLKYNVFDHGGDESRAYDIKIGQDDKNIIITFADEGKGFDVKLIRDKALELGYISPEYAQVATESEIIDLIFKEYFSSRYEKGKAHGLGLWLCRQVIEQYFKGTITAENAQGHSGAVFIIRIPRVRKTSIIDKLNIRQNLNIGLGLIISIPLAVMTMQHAPGLISSAGEEIVIPLEIGVPTVSDNRFLIDQAI